MGQEAPGGVLKEQTENRKENAVPRNSVCFDSARNWVKAPRSRVLLWPCGAFTFPLSTFFMSPVFRVLFPLFPFPFPVAHVFLSPVRPFEGRGVIQRQVDSGLGHK